MIFYTKAVNAKRKSPFHGLHCNLKNFDISQFDQVLDIFDTNYRVFLAFFYHS